LERLIHPPILREIVQDSGTGIKLSKMGLTFLSQWLNDSPSLLSTVISVDRKMRSKVVDLAYLSNVDGVSSIWSIAAWILPGKLRFEQDSMMAVALCRVIYRVLHSHHGHVRTSGTVSNLQQTFRSVLKPSDPDSMSIEEESSLALCKSIGHEILRSLDMADF